MGYTVIVNGQRPCIVCGNILQLDNFAKYKYTTRQGKRSERYSSKCKACEATRRASRHRQNRVSELLKMKEYRGKNRDEMNRKLRDYRAGNQEKVRKQRVISEQKRRSVGYNRSVSGIKETIERVLDAAKTYDGFIDAYSGKTIQNPTIDHIIPLATGGCNTFDNLCVTSRRNNISKFNKPLLRWFIDNAGSIPY